MEVYELYQYYSSVAKCFTQYFKWKLFKRREKKKVIKKEAKALFFMHTNKRLYNFQTDI